ncbi:TPA: hypothetical protein EYP26_02130 [Candidatus Bathyarchaeota archaeon]|nr:hypothetical protein [Candidatus Bathyarchaeota archaeon]
MVKPAVQKYFRLINERRFKEAEGELEKFKNELERSEEALGYLKALEGILLSKKSGDEKLYLTRIEKMGKKEMKRARSEFLSHSKNELHGAYDRGFFKALLDYLDFLKKVKFTS